MSKHKPNSKEEAFAYQLEYDVKLIMSLSLLNKEAFRTHLQVLQGHINSYFEGELPVSTSENKLIDNDKLTQLSSVISQIENAMERWHHARDNDDETLEEINSILSNIGLLGWFNKDKTAKNKPKNRLKWYNSEQDKPIAGQEIIFIDNVGMYKGTYHAIRDGVVYVENKASDTIEWEDIFQWIEYPEY
jgi:hypothetical protein